MIGVRDRAGLEALAGRAYGVPEAEYARLFVDDSTPIDRHAVTSLALAVPA